VDVASDVAVEVLLVLLDDAVLVLLEPLDAEAPEGGGGGGKPWTPWLLWLPPLLRRLARDRLEVVEVLSEVETEVLVDVLEALEAIGPPGGGPKPWTLLLEPPSAEEVLLAVEPPLLAVPLLSDWACNRTDCIRLVNC